MTLHGRGIQLALIAALQVLGMSMWFSASAVVPALQEAWHIGDGQATWITASVQLGFVTGAVVSAALNLPDRIAPQHVAAGSAVAAAAATVAVALLANGFWAALPLRFVTGMFLVGIYPVGMKLMASWFGSAGRGLALGTLIGALTVGSALPHLVRGLGGLPWQLVLLVSAAAGVVAALLAVAFVRPGPQLGRGPMRHRPRYAVEMLRERGPLLTNLGYFGHMWELYALWTWLPAYLVASLTAEGAAEPPATVTGPLAFVAIGVAGAIGCLVGGRLSDRIGRPPVAAGALVASGACCLLAPLLFGAGLVVLVPFLLVWGASVIADSGVFSTVLSEVADQRYVGTALTAQTAIGFLITVISINLVPVTADAVGWPYAFVVLAPGPALGAAAMLALHRTLGRSGRHNPPAAMEVS